MTDATKSPDIPELPIDVTVAEPADRERALRTIVDAFESDPFLRLALPDDAEYAEHAPLFFGALFDRRVERTTVWLANGGDAVALWDGPGVARDDDPTDGLPKQAKSVIDRYERSVHELVPSRPHWYLGVLATAPSARGRGLARAVMRQGLSHAASAALPAILETTNEGNLEIYRRLGWRIIAEANDPLPIWVLQYDVPGS